MANTTSATKPANETTESKTPAVDSEAVKHANEAPRAANNAAAVLKWAAAPGAVDEGLKAHGQLLESNGHYKDLGFCYAAPAPVANAIGGEVGVVTKDEKTGTVQRTGVGLYIRSDHMADYKYASSGK